MVLMRERADEQLARLLDAADTEMGSSVFWLSTKQREVPNDAVPLSPYTEEEEASTKC